MVGELKLPNSFDGLCSELRQRLSGEHARMEDIVQIARRLPGFEGHLRQELEGERDDEPEAPLERIVMRFGMKVISHQLDRFLGAGRRAQ